MLFLLLVSGGMVLLPLDELLESGGVAVLLPLEPDDPLVPAGGGVLSVVLPGLPVAPGVVLSVAPGVLPMLLELPPVLPGALPAAPGVVLSLVLPGLVADPLMLPDEEEGLSLLLVPAVLPVVPELLVPLSDPLSQAAKAREATNALSNTEYFILFPLKNIVVEYLP